MIYDVCIVGAGPAGTACAARLSAMSYRCVIVHDDRMPRGSMLQTVPASLRSLLREIEADDLFDRFDWPIVRHATTNWHDSDMIDAELEAPVHLIRRHALDVSLRERCKVYGVSVQLGRVCSAARTLHGWTIDVGAPGPPMSVKARFLVDATGGTRLLPGRARRTSQPLLCLSIVAATRSNFADRLWIEALEEGWLWAAPLRCDAILVCLFTGRTRLQSNSPSLSERADIMLRESCLATRLDGIDSFLSAIACDASARIADTLVGPDFIRIGDAAVRLDPISGQGTTLAFTSGLQAAVVINSILLTGDRTLAEKFYVESRGAASRRHSEKTAALYSQAALRRDGIFWRDRSGSAPGRTEPAELAHFGKRIRISPEAVLSLGPILRDDRIVEDVVLRHPNLDRAAYVVGGIPVAPLLARVTLGNTAATTIEDWTEQLGGPARAQLARELFSWMWNTHVIISAE